MALQSSGTISFSDINTELLKGGSESLSFSDSRFRNLLRDYDGTINLSTSYSKNYGGVQKTASQTISVGDVIKLNTLNQAQIYTGSSITSGGTITTSIPTSGLTNGDSLTHVKAIRNNQEDLIHIYFSRSGGPIGRTIALATVSNSTQLSSPSYITVANDYKNKWSAAAFPSSDRHLIAWKGNNNLGYFSIINSSGTIISNSVQFSNNVGVNIDVVESGSNLMILYNGASNQIRRAIISNSGSVISDSQIISTSTSFFAATNFSNGNIFLAGNSFGTMPYYVLNSSGTVTSSGSISSSYQPRSALGASGSDPSWGPSVLWAAQTGSSTPKYYAVSSSGTLIVSGSNFQTGLNSYYSMSMEKMDTNSTSTDNKIFHLYLSNISGQTGTLYYKVVSVRGAGLIPGSVSGNSLGSITMVSTSTDQESFSSTRFINGDIAYFYYTSSGLKYGVYSVPDAMGVAETSGTSGQQITIARENDIVTNNTLLNLPKYTSDVWINTSGGLQTSPGTDFKLGSYISGQNDTVEIDLKDFSL